MKEAIALILMFGSLIIIASDLYFIIKYKSDEVFASFAIALILFAATFAYLVLN